VLEGLAGAGGERKPRLVVQTPGNERGGWFSPDGRWLAYTSDEQPLRRR